jgi:FkbM family methyltransferase
MLLAELKYEFIRTPLERPLFRLRHAMGWLERHRHPELREIHEEDARIQQVLERALKPASSCVDVGCHYGSMLSQLCRLAPGGRHVAFEVVPRKARFLRRKFPDVDVRQVALSDLAGQARFFVRRDAAGFSSLARPAARDVEEIQVETARLDDVLPADRRFDFLKLDVEGAELLVVRGARVTLARHRPLVLFECGPGGPSAFGYRPGDLHDFLTGGAGFSVFFLKDFIARRTAVGRAEFEDACSRYPFKAFNWVAVPGDRVGQL